MGETDGFLSALANRGNNAVIKFEGGYFSFAFNNEIALVLENKFFILNSDESLWNEVKEQVKQNPSVKNLKKFWLNKSKNYQISSWSDDFGVLK